MTWLRELPSSCKPLHISGLDEKAEVGPRHGRRQMTYFVVLLVQRLLLL
jgi:hypothetical protein